MQRLNFSWTGSTLRHVHTDPVSASILRPHGPYFNIYLEGVPIKSAPAAVGPQALEFVKLLVRAAAEDEAIGALGLDIIRKIGKADFTLSEISLVVGMQSDNAFRNSGR
jgi:hypothetical protein